MAQAQVVVIVFVVSLLFIGYVRADDHFRGGTSRSAIGLVMARIYGRWLRFVSLIDLDARSSGKSRAEEGRSVDPRR